MKIFIVCSSIFYDQVPHFMHQLSVLGHQPIPPIDFNDPHKKAKRQAPAPTQAAIQKSPNPQTSQTLQLSIDSQSSPKSTANSSNIQRPNPAFTREIIFESIRTTQSADALLYLNYPKVASLHCICNNDTKKFALQNYIGPAVLLELYEAWTTRQTNLFTTRRPT